MGRQQHGSRTHSKNKTYKKLIRTRRRKKDLDQIQDEMKTHDPSKLPVDQDLPGLGQHMCLTCDRYFMSDTILQQHNKTKPHKRKLKLALEKPYSQAEAEAA